MSDIKDVSFWTGVDFLKFMGSKQSLDPLSQQFVSQFEGEADKYTALLIIEDRPVLSISRCDQDFFDKFVVSDVYNPNNPVYNLYYGDLSNDPFFIETAATLKTVLEVCEAYGFEAILV